MGFKPPVIEQKYYFDATAETMVRYLTDRKELVKWLLSDARIKPEVGSTYKFTWRGGSNHAGKVEKVVPGKTLVLTWPNVIRGKEYRTKVSFSIAKKGRGSVVKLRHTGFKEGDDWLWLFGAIQSGWAYFMTNLKSVVSQGKDLRSDFDGP